MLEYPILAEKSDMVTDVSDRCCEGYLTLGVGDDLTRIPQLRGLRPLVLFFLVDLFIGRQCC